MKRKDEASFLRRLSSKPKAELEADEKFREQVRAQTLGELPTPPIETLDQYIKETTMPNVHINDNQRPTKELKLEIPLDFDTLIAKSEKDKEFCSTFNALTRHIFASPNEDQNYSLVITSETTPEQVKRELDDPAFRRNIQTLVDKIQIEKDKKSRSEELLSRLNQQFKSALEDKDAILAELLKESREASGSTRTLVSKKIIGEKVSVIQEKIKTFNKEITRLKKEIDKREEINHNLSRTVPANIASIEKLAIQLGESIGLKRMR